MLLLSRYDNCSHKQNEAAFPRFVFYSLLWYHLHVWNGNVFSYINPHLRVWYRHTFRFHCWPASHPRGDVCVASSRAWGQVSASLLQRQLPPGQVRPHWMSPPCLGPVLLSPAVPHAVGSWTAGVFCRHGSHGVCETAGLFVRVGVQPLTTRVTTHSHGRRGGGSGAEGESNGQHPQASTWPGPACGRSVQDNTRAGNREGVKLSAQSAIVGRAELHTDLNK